MRSNLCFLALAATVLSSEASENNVASATLANPIRKVVTLLQAMQSKVEKEGEAEKKLYEKFMCYCQSGSTNLEKSIGDAETKVSGLASDIEASEGKLEQMKADLKDAQVERAAAKEAMAQATGIREKEAAAYAAEKAEHDANIGAITTAVASLTKGAGGFLQTGAAQILRRLALSAQEMPEEDRKELTSFLSETHSSGYVPQSTQIIGILKEMGDTMAKSLADATTAEETSAKTYEELMAAKNKEVTALTRSIETKTSQIGEIGVAIVRMKEDSEDTATALAVDQKFIAELKKDCKTKTSQWEERSKTRADELVALADTIKLLNDDDALELFKKTLPSASASFVQVRRSAASVRSKALAMVRGAMRTANHQDSPGLDLLVLALSGKRALGQGGFDKVIKMCDSMVEVLKKEQDDDDHKKEYCGKQFDFSDDKKKGLEQTISDQENAIATAKDGIATVTEEIASLEAGIVALDKSVAEATEQRKEENLEFKDLMSSNAAAKELIGFAKNRLNKFYNPKLYKPPPKAELSAHDRIAANMGVAAVFVQISAHHQSAMPPPPETWDAYAKKSEESTGVMAMMDLLVKDLDKEMVEAEAEEKDAQADYEVAMKDSAEKRTADSKSLTAKGAFKADLEGALEGHKESKADASKELMATMKYIASLHAECDWLLKYFDVRKEARAGEIDSLQKAKAVLSGADYSLAQTKMQGFLKR